jgi:hypothetical protein
MILLNYKQRLELLYYFCLFKIVKYHIILWFINLKKKIN